MYLLTANGVFEETLDANGFPNQHDYGNSFLKLSTAGGSLSVADYFTLSNTSYESSDDMDLGSGGIMLLPDLTDAGGTTRHLAVGAGKDGNIYVVNRDSMGNFSTTSNNIWQQLTGVLGNRASGGELGGIWSTPAYFNGSVYYGPSGGHITRLHRSAARSCRHAGLHQSAELRLPRHLPGRLGERQQQRHRLGAREHATRAVLYAFDAANLAHELYNSTQAGSRDQFGAGNKFITPMVADGKVFVGTTNGVAVFGLLN